MIEQTAEQSMAETEVRRRVNRRRQHLALTCHSETIAKLDQLCVRFSSTRGRVVDRLVETLYRAYTSGNLVYTRATVSDRAQGFARGVLSDAAAVAVSRMWRLAAGAGARPGRGVGRSGS